MILPDKNIKFNYSLLSCGAVLLQNIGNGCTVSELREKTKNNDSLISYDTFILTLDLLYIIGSISYNNGLIKRSHDVKINIE